MQAIGQAAIQQGYRVLYCETKVLLNELAEAIPEGTGKEFMESLTPAAAGSVRIVLLISSAYRSTARRRRHLRGACDFVLRLFVLVFVHPF